MRQSALRPFKRGLLFGRFLKNFPWSPLCTFSENAGFGWPCLNCHNLAIRALLEPLFCPKIFSSLCTLTAYKLEDNAICLRVFLGFLSEGYFLGDFWVICLGPPFTLFQKMRVLGDLAIIAITCPFGHFWSHCLCQNLFQSLHFKCILIRVWCNLLQSAVGPFKQGLLFGRFLKNFLWSPFSTFSENVGLGWPCEICNNLRIRALLEPLFAPKSSPVLAL